MSILTNYAHREYKNDVESDFGKRLAVSALPFLSLYKPFSFPIMVGTSALRVYTCWQNNDTLQTTLAVSALVFTIFAFPIGMLITTGQDLFNEIKQLGQDDQFIEHLAHIANSGLYAALILTGFGSLQLIVASLSMQIALGLFHAIKEYNKGNTIEGLAHLGMAAIRSLQLSYVLGTTHTSQSTEVRPQQVEPFNTRIAHIERGEDGIALYTMADGSEWQSGFKPSWKVGDNLFIKQVGGTLWYAVNEDYFGDYIVITRK